MYNFRNSQLELPDVLNFYVNCSFAGTNKLTDRIRIRAINFFVLTNFIRTELEFR